jgi:hypothetical protein
LFLQPRAHRYVIDHGLGGMDSDVFVFGALAALLIVAAGLRWSSLPSATL